MYQFLIDAGADIGWKATIAQESRRSIVLCHDFHGHLIQLPGADAGADGLPQHSMHPRHDPPRLPHDLNLTRAFEHGLWTLLLLTGLLAAQQT